MQNEDINRRLTTLEEWRHQIDIDKARSDENKKHIDLRFDRIEASLVTIQNIWNKIVWLVASGIILSFLTFLIKGGLNVS